MFSFRQKVNFTGWLTFAIATVVYFLSAERTGSLWDCGEFVSGAYKLEVVHPPGAPLFLLIGRLFTLLPEWFSSNPENIAFAVNLLSGVCSAFTAMFIAWITIILGKLALVGRNAETSEAQSFALMGSGLAAGLATAFATSIWFSAVEGEVYAMSTFFTALTMWAVMKWYNLPNVPASDKWLIFAVYGAGLSIGVHLLSILTFPALAWFYYFKRYKNHTLLGMLAAAGVGVVLIGLIQVLVIIGLPKLWTAFELMTVNGMGLPIHTGLIPVIALLALAFYFAIRYAHRTGNHIIEMFTVGALMIVVGFSTIGIVVVRANANPPINMNDPSDAMRLVPYLNREQYGERPLFKGPHFDAKPIDTKTTDRYGRVGDKYEIVDEKVEYIYRDNDKMLFCRMSDPSQGRPDLYRAWTGSKGGTPTMADNIKFLFRYQLGWMYWRYFFWNFSGRQNGEQGLFSWDPKSGHAITGINFIDKMNLGYDMSLEPASRKSDPARNKYFALPLIFGLLGLWFHFRKNTEDALGLMALFIITGIGIVIYSNQPPNEPRERDYVLVGSIFTFAIWIGMGVLALFEILKDKAKLGGMGSAAIASLLVLVAPAIMGWQNFDDHSRRDTKGSRDYGSNFLNSVEKNAIVFTYGDNDTYPLWYAQEVEGIRRDVRVVNLSLIAVDWYINQLRRKVNDSPAINMTVPADAIRGKKRNTVPYYNPNNEDRETPLIALLKFIGADNPLQSGSRKIESFIPTRRAFLPIDKEKMIANGVASIADSANIVSRIDFEFKDDNYFMKDDIAVLDIIATNLHERPVYFAVTCRPDNMWGLQDYMQLEGLALRIVPVKSQSDRRFGVIGNGRVDGNKFYENVMDKFRWGNFDKKKLYVSSSYGPSIQSHRLTMMRAAENFLAQGDTTRAVAIADKYLEVFPHMNFPYDYNTMLLLNIYVAGKAYDKAKPAFRTLAEETADNLRFFYTLDPKLIEPDSEFGRDFGFLDRTKDEILRAATQMGDQAFEEEMKKILEPYNKTQTAPK
jgi:hypothetical protein